MARTADLSGTGPGPAGAPGPGAGADRPRLWSELAIVLICYFAYEFIRNLVPTERALALQHGHELLNAESKGGVDVEYSLNRLFVDHAWLAVPANYFYSTMIFVMTIGVLVWLYWRRPAAYRVYRTALFFLTLIGLLGFWLYPLAPPRMLAGFTDTVITFGTWGIYTTGPTASVSNQYAAMPSMHTAWSLWCAAAIIAVARRRWVVVLAALYPVATILVIMGTANHYLLDAVGGVTVAALGLVLAYGGARVLVPWFRRSPARESPYGWPGPRL
ncbi:phosphatase PAP2 family protein [Actinomadura harenae]|uniref:Phosphatase PAP2 family protein n=1 Tax=Actinomadura harenae TaxID=2483351 RepID=A0A3M2LT65_9ACTN|nr:phosphatase PAP2 family protein [Actinomadura harenae]RMI39773.1 phosphatase PAP2 family protein [Actinomadura harenae]